MEVSERLRKIAAVNRRLYRRMGRVTYKKSEEDMKGMRVNRVQDLGAAKECFEVQGDAREECARR